MRKKNKTKSKKTNKNKDVVFIELLISLSMRHANSTRGSLRDIFLHQALRLDQELEKLENKQIKVTTNSGNA